MSVQSINVEYLVSEIDSMVTKNDLKRLIKTLRQDGCYFRVFANVTSEWETF